MDRARKEGRKKLIQGQKENQNKQNPREDHVSRWAENIFCFGARQKRIGPAHLLFLT